PPAKTPAMWRRWTPVTAYHREERFRSTYTSRRAAGSRRRYPGLSQKPREGAPFISRVAYSSRDREATRPRSVRGPPRLSAPLLFDVRGMVSVPVRWPPSGNHPVRGGPIDPVRRQHHLPSGERLSDGLVLFGRTGWLRDRGG